MFTYRHDAKDAVARRSQGVSCAALGRGKDLGSVAVQDGVHDVAAKVEAAVPSEERIAAGGGGRGKEEDAGENGKDGKGSLAANAR